MKKVLNSVLLILIVFPMFMFCTACGTDIEESQVLSIEKTATAGYVDTYTITYSDGKTYSFNVTNGQSYDIEDIYQSAVSSGFQGTFLEFLETYLSYDEEQSALSINKSLLSVVSVYSKFTGTQTYMQMGRIYSKEVEYTSAGSGVIYSLDKAKGNAYIITNYHVVYDVDSKQEDGISDNISIYLYGSESSEYAINATFFGGSMNYDIAVLKVENSEFLKNSDAVQVEIANSNDIVVGEKAIAIGNPEALGISVTSGIVSVDSEYISMTSLDEQSTISQRVIRIDAAVNSGNSGGGLFNSDGLLIGIVNAKLSDNEIENIAYSIPSNVVSNIVQNIIANDGSFKRLILGLTIESKNSRSVYDSKTQKVSIVEDVLISSVEENSLASELGFCADDKVLSISINNQEIDVSRKFQMIEYLYQAKENDNVLIKVERNSEEKDISFVVSGDNLELY